jgi:sugar phosphate permease
VNTLTTRPSRIRWLILALLFLISVGTYIDRVNISVTARQMMQTYGITDQEMRQEKKGGAELAQYVDHQASAIVG